MVKNIKKQNGITLMTIIITIVVLLILLGVAISIAIDKEFIGKAEYADQLNEEAISKAEKDEENALKQNAESFQVKEEYETSEIRPYELIDSKNSKEESIKELIPIEYSLSKYIKDNGSSTIYFKMNTTNREDIYYTAEGVSGILYNEYYNENSQDVIMELKPISNKTNVEEKKLEESLLQEEQKSDKEIDGYKLKGTLIKVTLNEINGFKIFAKANESSEKVLCELEYVYKSKPIEGVAYIPTGENANISIGKASDKKSNKVILSVDGRKNMELAEAVDGAIISPKTAISTSSISKEGVNKYKIERSSSSTINKGEDKIVDESTIGDNKIYLVQEKTDKQKKTVYMDDCSFEFYNPIKSVDLLSPKYLDFIVAKENAVDIRLDYKTENLNSEEMADVKETKVEMIKNVTEIYKTTKSDDTQYKEEERFYIEENKIYSKINMNPKGFIQDEVVLKLQATDVGGGFAEAEAHIKIASDNFVIYALDSNGNKIKDGENEIIKYATKLSEAFVYAKRFGEDGEKRVVIEQRIKRYDIEDDEGLYTIEEIKNPNNDRIEKSYYLDIDKNYFKVDELIYDLNGNELNFIDEAKLRIGNTNAETKFTLRSSVDVDKTTGHQNGVINFRHALGFEEELKWNDVSWEGFFKVEKYQHLKSIKTYLAHIGKGTSILELIIYVPIYEPLLMNERIRGYKEYLNSFNTTKIQNIDYKYRMEAVINQGTFNFESGKIHLETEEQVRAYGGWGSGIVLNIAEKFLTILRECGIDIASITEYTSSYAKLEHTAAGILNYGNVILGTGSGISLDTSPYPEIFVKVSSKEEGIGLSVGSIHDPNQTISRAYGIWNAKGEIKERKNENGQIVYITEPVLEWKDGTVSEYGKTTMNSGFIEMGIVNMTNNWVSLGVGRAYGIFNDGGETTINGMTTKIIRRDFDLWGIKNSLDKFESLYKAGEDPNKIEQFFQKVSDKIDDLVENLQGGIEDLEKKRYEGFFTFSTQQILTRMTGGATTVYTASYGVANAAGREVYRFEDENDKDRDGIIFKNIELKPAEFEIQNVEKGSLLDILLPENAKGEKVARFPYYVIKDCDGNWKDYKDNIFQIVVNPLEHYFEFRGALGTATSGGQAFVNNLPLTSWIGQDFDEGDGLLEDAASLIFRSIKQIFTDNK